MLTGLQIQSITFMNEEDYESPDEILNQHLDGIIYHIEQGMFSRRDLEYLHKKTITKLNETLDDGTPKNYLNLDQGKTAYSKILDTGITAQEALEYVASCYGKDKDWVEEVKNNNYLHAKEVVKSHTDHPVQKAMVKDGTFRAKALSYSKTPNHQLRELHSQRKLHSTLNELKGTTNLLSDKVDDLEVQTVIADVNINTVLDLLGIDHLTSKEKASKLKAKGITQKKISEYLGVSLKTIKRWWGSL